MPPPLLPRDAIDISSTGVATITIGLLIALAVILFLTFHHKIIRFIKPAIQWRLYKPRPTKTPSQSSSPPSVTVNSERLAPCVCQQIQQRARRQHIPADFVICGFKRGKVRRKTKRAQGKKASGPRRVAVSTTSASSESSDGRRRNSRRGRSRVVRQVERMPDWEAAPEQIPEGGEEVEEVQQPEPVLEVPGSQREDDVDGESGYHTADEGSRSVRD